MHRVQGNKDTARIECVNPVKNKWRIRWDYQQRQDGSATFMEAEFLHKPTVAQIKEGIIPWYNSLIDQQILSGFSYEGMKVWLSSENQFNYKSAYDLAVQTSGATLPVTFKFGTDEQPQYRKFETLSELSDFYTKAMTFIQNTLANGWKQKDSVDWSKYGEEADNG